MKNIILIGDVIEQLKNIPDKTVNTCVTSPPYWGLRDYGTAEWKGGDSECDHVANQNATKKMGNEEFNKTTPSREKTKTKGYYADICPKCGAIRIDNQIGLEKTPELYVDKMVKVFREVRRVLRNDGTLWLNLGDSYSGSGGAGNQFGQLEKDGFNKYNQGSTGLKQKDLVGIPWMVAFALRADGWYLRQDIIWHKPNPMPESVKDRCTKAHEYIFLLSKSPKYYYDYEAIKEPANYDGRKATMNQGSDKYKENCVPGDQPQSMARNGHERWEWKNGIAIRNKRSVWTVSTKPFSGSHFATFPPDLIEPCILAGSPRGGIVLDCFFGAGTTGKVSLKNGRYYIGIELKPEYAEMAENRIKYGTVDPEEIEAEKKQGVLF